MQAIPLVIMEEHHEAFFVWHACVRLGWLPRSGNCLLHVDEHADIGSPRLRQVMPGLASDSAAVLKFVFDELTCFEFIVPAAAQGLFDELIWLQQNPARRSDQLVVIRPDAEPPTRFDLHAFNLFKGEPVGRPEIPQGARLRYRHQAVDAPLPAMRQVVLDVDLDYFSCEDAVNLVQKLEITRAEYERYRNDRYHFLRVGQGSRIRVQQEGERYYLYLRDYQQAAPTPLKVTHEVIEQRMDRLIEVLQQNAVQPQLVNIARSRLSGYTPADQWDFIETKLLERLRRLYELQPYTLEQLHALCEAAPRVSLAQAV
jgi:hypothetical protein